MRLRVLAGRYLCDELGKRLTSSIGYSVAYRQHQRHSPDARPARCPQPGFRRPGRRREISSGTRVDATKYFGLAGGFHLSRRTARAATSIRLQDSPSDGQDAIRITDRFFGAADARLRHPRHRPARSPRYPYDDHRRCDRRSEVTSATRSAAGPITWAGSKLEFPISSALRSLGLRPSAFVDIGSVWKLTDRRRLRTGHCFGTCSATDRSPTTGVTPATSADAATRTTDRASRFNYVASSGYQGILHRQFGQAAPVGRHRRQLGIAVRSAAYRYRQGPAQAGRRRNQILLVQRRNPILMKN